MRRLLILASALALTVPALGATPASAAITCSVQANHTGGPPYGYTAAVNCPEGTELVLCGVVATVVAEVIAGNPAGVPWIPQPVLEPTCGNKITTEQVAAATPISGSRHITAVFAFATTAEDVTLVPGGQTSLLVWVPDVLVPDLIVHFCVANSTSYVKP